MHGPDTECSDHLSWAAELDGVAADTKFFQDYFGPERAILEKFPGKDAQWVALHVVERDKRASYI